MVEVAGRRDRSVQATAQPLGWVEGIVVDGPRIAARPVMDPGVRGHLVLAQHRSDCILGCGQRRPRPQATAAPKLVRVHADQPAHARAVLDKAPLQHERLAHVVCGQREAAGLACIARERQTCELVPTSRPVAVDDGMAGSLVLEEELTSV
eukprot:1490385-Prymnesium_polylepis.1